MSGGQRTWRRVEAPETFRGHALAASIRGADWLAWENPDGSWTLQGGPEPQSQIVRHDWTAVRHVAEGAPMANPIPLDPVIASAALAGATMAMRNAFASNPAPNPCQMAVAHAAFVHDVLPPSWLVDPPVWTPAGSMVVRVQPGLGPASVHHLHAAGAQFPIEVVEGRAARLPNPAPPADVRDTLAALRAAYFTHRNAHWQARAYGNHLLLKRLYEESSTNTDAWAEQMVGYFGPEAVTLTGAQLGQIADDVQRFEAEAEPLRRSLAAVLELRQRLARTYDSMKASRIISLGWDDLIMSIARNNDSHAYLLQQALAVDPAQVGGQA